MGRATILSNLGGGLYRVRLLFDRRRGEAQIARLQREISDLEAALPDLEAAEDQAYLDEDFAQQVLSAKISAYRSDPSDENKQAVETAQKEQRQALQALTLARAAVRDAKLRRTAAQKRIQFLQQRLPADREVDAWCADFSEALAGYVGTIEPGRVDADSPILRPGGGYVPSRDGQLQPIMSSTPAAAALNYALLPGVAKWRPRYRVGTIGSVDQAAGTCAVTLDPLYSTHQRLFANQGASLADVPIVYMDCNAEAFDAGDRVVVEFGGQDWAQPRVIGFESHPVPCDGFRLVGPFLEKETDNTYTAVDGCAPYAWLTTDGLMVVGGGTANDDTITVRAVGGADACGVQAIHCTSCDGQTAEKRFDLGACADGLGGGLSPNLVITGPAEIACQAEATYTVGGGYKPYTWDLSEGGMGSCLEILEQSGSTLRVRSRLGTCCATSKWIAARDALQKAGHLDVAAGLGCWVGYYSVGRSCSLYYSWSGTLYGSNPVKKFEITSAAVGGDRSVTLYKAGIEGTFGCSGSEPSGGQAPDADMLNQIAAWNAMTREELIAEGLIPATAPPDYPEGPVVYLKERVTYEQECGS